MAAAKCSAVLLYCRDAAHTHAGKRPAGGWVWRVSEADALAPSAP